MPKRVIDFDAMWWSDKLAACAAWAQAEYAWLYGLADASGCFELTNLRVIWGRVAAVRGNFTIERLEQVFAEFQDKGLLFVWEYEGKRYAHWTGSDVPGRLPPPSWRMRLEKFAPPVPKQQLAEYMARFARGRAALAGVGFHGEAQRESYHRKDDLKFESSDLKRERGPGLHSTGSQLTDPRLLVTDCGEDRGYQSSDLKENGERGARFENSRPVERQAPAAGGVRDAMGHERRDFLRGRGLKEEIEGAPAQDLGLDLNLNLDGNWEEGRDQRQSGPSDAQVGSGNANRKKDLTTTDFYNSNSQLNTTARAMSPKELAVARELRVGQGPVCGPARVRPEVLERVRRREAARAGSRSP
jgi:hypothetical protein